LPKQLRRGNKRNTGDLRQKQNFYHLLSIFKNKYTDLTPFRTPAI